MKQRIITGVIAAVLFIGITLYGSWPFSILILLLAGIGMYELLRMKGMQRSFIGLIGYGLAIVLALQDSWMDVLAPFTKTDAIILAVLLLLVVTVVKKNETDYNHISFILFSSIYVGFGFYYLVETRILEDGIQLLFFILFMIWATDSGAYFVGKSMGKRKLWPVISPNKTIEGAVGGIFFSIVVAIICYVTSFVDLSLITILIISVLVGVFGQIGDLAESAFKRIYHVKDSGVLLPGHGGILDRLDSALFVLPLLHVLHLLG
ncbi:phosphatidate cytidylyltransferase [Fictibacillus nanhaiensis]|uniref:phosphatidate cytidylyltransferase n=1 Tax=Fictibacillus nanhaiensis TaxID=742169 RepID=UPI001C961C29|nr:phosphatidate cytidylyltransferase [Fictibacillus nanhaiensis]MBY6036060.1 phosphatidate cytidylyltransferase [Fictibacillus nanhaiensis]